MKRKLTANEKARIRARSGLALDTIRKIDEGDPDVREASMLRFDRAVIEEGIDRTAPPDGRAA